MSGIPTATELPAGAIPLNVVEIVSYVDADGEQAVKVRADSTGGAIMLHDALGLLSFAEHFLVREKWPSVEVDDGGSKG